MGHDTSKQEEPPESHGFSCTCCDQSLTPDTIRMAHRFARKSDGNRWIDLSQDEKAQQLTSMAASETACVLANLLLLCDNCHRALDGGKHVPLATQPQTFIDAISYVAAADLIPTAEQFRVAVRLVKAALRVGSDKPPSYVIEHALAAMTLQRWSEVAQQPELPAQVQQESLADEARSLALMAARDARSSAVELRRTYLVTDTKMTIDDRNAAVVEFGRKWLGWRCTVSEEKVQALIDALLSDEWPSEWHAGGDNVLPLLRKLVRRHYRDWRPFHKGQINGQSIISHSIRTHAPSGEGAELIELIAAPSFQTHPQAPVVRSVLSELDPLEQDVWWTYADCPGRRSWKKSAQLNGQPEAFGEDRVRRKILRRLATYENKRAGRRHTPEG